MRRALIVSAMLTLGTPALAATPVAQVVLAADGFVIRAPSKPVQTIRFKVPRAQALTAATRLFGQPVAQRKQGDCAINDGQFSIVRFRGGFELSFDRGRFSGWTVTAGNLRTANGIGVGSDVTQLRKAYPNVFIDPGDEEGGGLGPTFQVDDGPSGFLDGDRVTSRITGMFAGATCIVN